MEEMGVISPIEEATEWCSGMVVVPKPNGKIRICVDLTRLNENVCRERHILPAVDETLAKLAGARIFSKLDATAGFWQVPLHKDSAPLTTFITPIGRYCFNRLPFGISSGPEHFQKRLTQMPAWRELCVMQMTSWCSVPCPEGMMTECIKYYKDCSSEA